jgi:hypothetical protein
MNSPKVLLHVIKIGSTQLGIIPGFFKSQSCVRQISLLVSRAGLSGLNF